MTTIPVRHPTPKAITNMAIKAINLPPGEHAGSEHGTTRLDWHEPQFVPDRLSGLLGHLPGIHRYRLELRPQALVRAWGNTCQHSIGSGFAVGHGRIFRCKRCCFANCMDRRQGARQSGYRDRMPPCGLWFGLTLHPSRCIVCTASHIAGAVMLGNVHTGGTIAPRISSQPAAMRREEASLRGVRSTAVLTRRSSVIAI